MLDVKIEGLDGLLERMKALPKEMAKNGGPIRSALFQGAKIVREEAKANVRAIVAEPNANGMDAESTGHLEKQIIMKRHRNPQARGASEIYTVRVKRKASPKGVPATRYGKILEFGSEHVKAYAWLRKAAAEKQSAVFAAIAKYLKQGIKRIEKKAGVR